MFLSRHYLVIWRAGQCIGSRGSRHRHRLGLGRTPVSFLTIVLGAAALGVERKAVGILVILSSLAGAILGGTIVAI